MRISPITYRSEISAISRTAKVTRALHQDEEEKPAEEDNKDRKNKRPHDFGPTSATARSSNAVLSALIDLQAEEP